jgi:hypothetical protein
MLPERRRAGRRPLRLPRRRLRGRCVWSNPWACVFVAIIIAKCRTKRAPPFGKCKFASETAVLQRRRLRFRFQFPGIVVY